MGRIPFHKNKKQVSFKNYPRYTVGCVNKLKCLYFALQHVRKHTPTPLISVTQHSEVTAYNDPDDYLCGLQRVALSKCILPCKIKRHFNFFTNPSVCVEDLHFFIIGDQILNHAIRSSQDRISEIIIFDQTN